MGYDLAKSKAWQALVQLGFNQAVSVKFLADEYTVSTEDIVVLAGMVAGAL